MAKFIPGPLVSEIRNALGAQVFSRNQFGAFTRARVDPDNTETPDRLIAKEAIQAAAIAWGTTLTDSQRSAWNAFADALRIRARSPILTHNNGVSLFTKLWLLAYWWSGNFLTDPPLDLDTPSLTTAVLTNDAPLSELIVTFTPTPVPSGQILMVYATESLNAGVTRPHRWFKPVAMFPAATTSPQNIWTDYETAHGTPVASKKIFTRVKAAFTYNNFPSVPIQSQTLITTAEADMAIATRTLTPSEIMNLVATPIELIPAPGVGKAILPIRTAFTLVYNSVPYTNPNTAALWPYWNGFSAFTMSAGFSAAGITSTSSVTMHRGATDFGSAQALSSFENKSCILTHSPAEYAGAGNSDIICVIVYSLVDV